MGYGSQAEPVPHDCSRTISTGMRDLSHAHRQSLWHTIAAVQPKPEAQARDAIHCCCIRSTSSPRHRVSHQALDTDLYASQITGAHAMRSIAALWWDSSAIGFCKGTRTREWPVAGSQAEPVAHDCSRTISTGTHDLSHAHRRSLWHTSAAHTNAVAHNLNGATLTRSAGFEFALCCESRSDGRHKPRTSVRGTPRSERNRVPERRHA